VLALSGEIGGGRCRRATRKNAKHEGEKSLTDAGGSDVVHGSSGLVVWCEKGRCSSAKKTFEEALLGGEGKRCGIVPKHLNQPLALLTLRTIPSDVSTAAPLAENSGQGHPFR
jgi:hypothetical protein